MIVATGTIEADLPDTNTGETADEDGATAAIQIAPVRFEIVGMITQQMVLVPIAEVPLAAVLPQKESKVKRTTAEEKGKGVVD
mmetsp:Transcript_12123/g.25665  ORF Transcript_12123/g.25665 Transcript_12123/m.25665 type:complete len:83 (+) Transcript_12123:636-884(+)